MNYALTTFNYMTFSALGTKLAGLPNEEVISISLFMGVCSLVHNVSLDIFKHFYEKSRSHMTSGLKEKDSFIEEKDIKTGKMTYRKITFEEQMSMPFIVTSCLISYKITEVIFKKISEEALKKALLFLGSIIVLNSHNLNKVYL